MIFKQGDAVEIIPGSKFVGNITVADKFLNTKFYVREVRPNNYCSIGVDAITGRSIGIISMDALRPYNEIPEGFIPFIIATIGEINTKETPDFLSKDKMTLPATKLYTVINEENGYGCLKNERGWIDLSQVKRLN
jgi:hypothetical protein